MADQNDQIFDVFTGDRDVIFRGYLMRSNCCIYAPDDNQIRRWTSLGKDFLSISKGVRSVKTRSTLNSISTVAAKVCHDAEHTAMYRSPIATPFGAIQHL